MISTEKSFYPSDARVPEELITKEFTLRPLGIHDVERDYEAVMESREMLRLWAGGSWPAEDFTITGNYLDLERHQGEHLAREAFTYTVVTPEEKTCLGCVYLEPIEMRLRQGEPIPDLLAEIGDYEALVRFWVRTSTLDASLDRNLFFTLTQWFEEDWHFRRIYFRANARDVRQVEMFEETGLIRRANLVVPGFAGPFWIYGQ